MVAHGWPTSSLRLIIVVASLVLIGCEDSSVFECEKTIKSEIVSTDGKLRAVVANVQCGATTEDANWILLREDKKQLDYKRDLVATFEGDVERVEWRDNTLVITYGSARPFTMEHHAKGIDIFYSKTR